MRKLFVFMFMVFSLQLFAQKYTAIKGTVKVDYLDQVNLYKTVEGQPQLCATSPVSSDGSYGFLFVPSAPGFYVLGDDKVNFMVYVKGGEEINLDIYKTKAMLNGRNTLENEALYKWEDYAADIRLKAVFFYLTMSCYKDFFPDFKKFLVGREVLRKSVGSGNQEFDRMLQKLIDYETDYFAAIFLQTPRTVHPQRSDWPEYYHHIVSEKKFTSDLILNFPWGMRMLSTYLLFASRNEDVENEKDIESILSYIHNDRLKGEYVFNDQFLYYKSYEQYLDGIKRYGNYFVTPSLKKRVEAIGAKLYETDAGRVAADFTYPDINGKNVSLSDFKGKVVLVDVWATWCGPCRSEIPYLKKLEKEMKGTNVVFIGVSVDESKDKQKWEDFIHKEKMEGIQLFASGWSKITEYYKITGIPRFMVFDKKGNIVSANSPRPSDPALKAMLETELKK